MLALIWLIPMLPLAGVAINGLFGRRLSRGTVGWIACLAVLASLVLAVGAVAQLAGLPEDERYFETSIATWIELDSMRAGGQPLRIDWGFALDPLSAVLLLVVTGVGFLIHVYSVGYMSHEADVARFFVYMNLFMAMMLTLVLGSNLLVLFVGWEGVGLCSYLLIGFFYDQPFDKRTGLSCADAGRKAFLVNRIGDFAFLIGLLYIALELGTLNFREMASALEHGHLAGYLLTGIGLLLFFGACGKSAQIPLYVWLPDAMAGPTPVSALIHAATMVTAGVYMVCRMSPLYAGAPEALGVVVAIGMLTALIAASMGLVATDIKKVLAYSTVSQLGFMFAAAGVGAYIAAMFHLMTHAFFKGLLFLGAGSVIHGMGGEQDIRQMGGLRKKMPTTFWTFAVATLAICGVFPFAGFFSKDEILAGAWFADSKWAWGVLTVAALMTAFYMTRLTWLVFMGEFRGDREKWDHAHESPPSMTVPLMVLAVLSLVGGWIGIPKVLSFGKDINVFHHWMEPAVAAVGGHHGEGGHAPTAAHDGGLEMMLVVIALVVAIAGILLAWTIYRREGLARRLAEQTGPLYVLLRNLYWVDEFYEAVIVRPFYALSRWFRTFDQRVVDGLVNASGITADVAGHVIKLFQTGQVRNYALMVLFGVVVILAYLLR